MAVDQDAILIAPPEMPSIPAFDILAQIADAVLAIDFEGRVLFWNEGAERLYGVAAADILGKFIDSSRRAEWLDAGDRDQVVHTARSKGSWYGESLLHLNDGRELLVEATVTILRDAQSSELGLLAVIRDITGRRQRELTRIQDAKKRETMLRTLIDNVTDLVYLKDTEGRYLIVNEAAARHMGRSPADFVGRDDFAIFPVEVAEEFRRSDAAVLASNQTLVFEELVHGTRNPRYQHTVKSVCRDAAGGILGVVGVGRDISERRRAERKLAISEARYRSLIEAGSNIVWTTTPEGNQIHDIPDWQAFTGQTSAEVKGFGWADAIHPEDRDATIAAWRTALTDGSLFEVEQRLLRHDGVYRQMTVRGLPVRDESGVIVEWVGMHTDITDRKEAEQALRESQSRFRKLSESSLMGICFPDRFGAFSDGNDEFLRVVGYTREDLDGGLVRWDNMTPLEYRELDAAHIAEAALRGSCTPYEKEYIRKDGTRVPILCGYALLEGSTDEYIGFVLDLTPQKRIEQALRDRERRFRALADSLPQLIWESAPSGENVFCNRRFTEYTGIPHEGLMGWSFAVVIHPEELERTRALWEECLRSHRPYHNEYRLRGRDGEYRTFLARAVPVFGQQGEVERWIGTATDIHDQKMAEEALRRSEKLASAGRLAASIAHEINNPLEAVTNALFLALMDPSLAPTTREYLTMAEQELARVAHVTTQTLRFHRQSHAAAPADLSEIMDSVFALFARRFKNSEIEVVREYRMTGKLCCFADELRQVFANLVGNALDATAMHGRLRIRIRDAGDWVQDGSVAAHGVRVTVADTGSGIPAHIRQKIFEPFVSTKDATGTGLGLWVSEGIIRKHQGRVAVRSRTDAAAHGTVFSIFLPHAATQEK